MRAWGQLQKMFVVLVLLLGMDHGLLWGNPTDFHLSNLKVTTNTVGVGKELVVSATITNQGAQAASCPVNLLVDNKIFATKQVGPLKAGQSSQLSFSLRFDKAGQYMVTIEDLPPVQITVINESRITLRNLKVEPTVLQPGQSGIVTVHVLNISLSPGNLTLELKVDNKVKDRLDMVLKGGQSLTVTFPLVFADGEFGNHPVTINHLAPVNVLVLGRHQLNLYQAIDENGNNRIDDPEILRAVGLWVVDLEVPGTNGERIRDPQVRDLIRLWVTGASLASAPQPFWARSPLEAQPI